MSLIKLIRDERNWCLSLHLLSANVQFYNIVTDIHDGESSRTSSTIIPRIRARVGDMKFGSWTHDE